MVLTACDFPLSPSKYTTRGRGDAGLESAPDARVAPSEFALVFARGDSSCARALEAECSSNLQTCQDTPGCQDFAGCVRELADPFAETKCGDELHTDLAARWAYEHLRGCWSGQTTNCSVGNNWRCVGNYSLPHSERSELTLSQIVRFFGQPSRPLDISVKVCGVLTDCAQPLASAETNAEGEYTVTIGLGNIAGGPGVGWEGYRILEGEDIFPARVETNQPVLGTRVEVTRVFDRVQLDSLRELNEATETEGVLVLVQDCESGPAPNVRLELETSTGEVVYADATRDRTDDTGGVAVHSVAADELLSLTAYNDANDPVASWDGVVPEGYVTYLRMYPEPR